MSTIPARGFRLRTFGGLRYGALAAVSSTNLGVVPLSRPASTSQLTTLICSSWKYDLHPSITLTKTRGFSSGNLPPHKKISLPALSPTMETGNIVSWQKKEGEQLSEGDLLCEIETDKATMGFETPEEGYLAKICIPEGTKGVPIGKLLCIIVDSEDAVAAFKDFKDGEGGAPAATSEAQAAAPSPPTPAPAAPKGDLPPCSRIALPALSPTMETGNIVSWQKKEGEQLAEGDVLCEIETDKATMSFETPEEGYLAKIVIPEGTKGVAIGKLLCIIVDSEDKVAAFKDFKDDGASAPAAAAPSGAAATPAQSAATTTPQDLPPCNRVALPALSPTMERGRIVSWQKKEGDQIAEGDVLCEIETDKATMGFEAPEDGYLAKIVIPENTKNVPIGKLLCIIVDSKDKVAAFKNFKDDGATVVPEAPAPSAPSSPPPPAAPAPATPPPSPVAAPPQPAAVHATGHVNATPFARKMAAERGVDISGVAGSGPGGRIIAADIKQAPAGVAAGVARPVIPITSEGGYTDIPLTAMRRTIAKRLSESKSTIPHYYLTAEINIDNLLKVREKLNKLLAQGTDGSTKISINDFIVKASALSCLRVPETNSFWMESFIRQNNTVDVSVAVSTPSGLITPIVFNAHAKGLATISAEITELAARARDGKLQPSEYQGGTFTVSNLGMFGSVTDFTAIINPPQSCILAVGGAETKIVPCEEEEYRSIKVMKVTLSCDHRVVDGAVGAVWLRHFKEFLEKPHTMLL
ncbi:hypothetical protein V3C99_015235 [Haemonchus contortus]